MKKILIFVAALTLTLSVSACSTQKKPEENTLQANDTQSTQETEMQTIIEEDTQNSKEATSTALPAYEYQGDNPYVGAISEYMTIELTKDYDEEDVSIPSIIVVGEDDSDPKDIKVWGIFEIYNYDQNGETLECQSGGSYAGLMHITQDKKGKYTVTSFDMVEDGSAFDQSAEKIFGKYSDEFSKKFADDQLKDDTRKEFIKDYVESNQLPITQYKDLGWDPVELK